MHTDLSAFGRSDYSFGALPPAPLSYEEPELDYPILAPDPNLMANMAAEEKQQATLKYIIIGLLGVASGFVVARQVDKPVSTGAAIGGLGAVTLVFIADLLRKKL